MGITYFHAIVGPEILSLKIMINLPGNLQIIQVFKSGELELFSTRSIVKPLGRFGIFKPIAADIDLFLLLLLLIGTGEVDLDSLLIGGDGIRLSSFCFRKALRVLGGEKFDCK